MFSRSAGSAVQLAFCWLLVTGLAESFSLRASESSPGAQGPLRVAEGSPAAQEEAEYSKVIPKILVLNAKEASIKDLPPLFQKNVRRTLEMSPGLKLRFLSDADCQAYLGSHYDAEIQGFAAKEKYGPYKGDICRAAVLAREGGYYIDIDLQPRLPLHRLVGNRTTFMTGIAADFTLLNAIIATTAQNPIQLEYLEHIRTWYRGTQPHRLKFFMKDLLMGPMTLYQAVETAVEKHCLSDMELEGSFLPQAVDELDCGPEVFTLYQEKELNCRLDTVDCSGKRRQSEFGGVKFGLFPASGRHVVAWPRFEECSSWGCH